MAAAVLPASRVPDSKDAPSLRWGIMGPGWIAERFTESVQAHSRQVIAAVGSRSLSRSKEFAEKFGVPAAYGSYEELASAPDVDIVYVTTPHNFHHSAALLALEAGKHVLVEKPIGLNAEQARDIAARARSAGVFATEAMWTFFLPKFDIIRQILEAGTLGTVTTVVAEYGEHFNRTHRIFDPALAGGPLLDLGTYPLALITELLGAPERMHVLGQPHESGVHAQLSAIMGFAGGSQAVMNTQLHNFTPTAATIVGSQATLTIDGPFNMPGGFDVASLPVGRKASSARWTPPSAPWKQQTKSAATSASLSLATTEQRKNCEGHNSWIGGRGPYRRHARGQHLHAQRRIQG
jgi:predicted dehydrogenase